jgi:hypothetical protein
MPARQRFFCHRMEGSLVCERGKESTSKFGVLLASWMNSHVVYVLPEFGMGLDKCTVGIETNRSIQLIQN